jgi:hypothetical protein
METMLFKDLITENADAIKSYMRWDNYDLNDTVIPVEELLKDHALVVLMNSYGLFHVEQDILEPLCADVFIYFPILLQQLAITRLIDAYGVVKDDTNTEEVTRTETISSEVLQNSELTQGTQQTDANVLNTQTKTTGTVTVENEVSNTQESETTIENSSGVESTGSRNVSLTHEMPEQAMTGGTGNFPTDPQGTPILTNAYVQNAAQNFTTANPINTSETSEQTVNATNTAQNDTTTTNDVTVADTGTTTRTVTNSGSDSSESLTETETTNTATETRTQTTTNKQYAYEIKAFLETADSLIAFKKWEDNFAWVVGII